MDCMHSTECALVQMVRLCCNGQLMMKSQVRFISLLRMELLMLRLDVLHQRQQLVTVNLFLALAMVLLFHIDSCLSSPRNDGD